MTITSIEKSKKNDRLQVYVDGSYSFSISEEDYISLNLYEKREITAEEIAHIRSSINLREAKSKAVKFLALKIRTEKEVIKKLEQEGFDLSIAEAACEELKSIGYINDEMYAQKYIYDRSKLKPKSKRFLKLELQQKGIEEDIIDKILDGWEIDDESVAEHLVKRKFGKYDLKDEKVRRKAYSFLMHRGFSSEVIGKTLKIQEEY